MSRFAPVCCFDCGMPIGPYWETYTLLRSKKIEPERIFKILRIAKTRYCCRMHLTTAKLPKELEVGNY